MQRKQNTQKQIKTSKTVVRGQRINIDGLYNQLKNAIDQRVKYQGEHDKIWSYIKRTNNNGTQKLDVVDKKIGACTHKINQLIAQLCKYKKTHKAMKLANDYLSKEINRIEKIINSNSTLINNVDRGRNTLISSSGVEHTNTTNLKKYVKLKKEQKAKLVQWKQYVSQYVM